MKIGFWGLLTIVFIVLKLTDVIAWSWWLVLLPAYGGLLLTFVFVIACYIIAFNTSGKG